MKYNKCPTKKTEMTSIYSVQVLKRYWNNRFRCDSPRKGRGNERHVKTYETNVKVSDLTGSPSSITFQDQKTVN